MTRSQLLALAGILLLAGVLFFHRLGERDLWSSHEARAAMNAASLLDADSDGLPRLHDGRPEMQKPPLYYLIVAAFGKLIGVDALAVRLPASLAALAVVGCLILLGFWLHRPRAGLLAALILTTTIHFVWLARIGRIDMPLTFTTTLAAGAFWLALRRSSAWFRLSLLLVAYGAIVLGLFLKGPIGLVLPGAIVAGHLLMERRWPAFWEWRDWGRLLHRLGVWWGLGIVLLAVVPVLIWLERTSQGRFVTEFFWHHNVQRGLGGSRLRSHPWWLYGPYLLLYFLPWTPLLLAMLFGGWQRDRVARFGLAWLLGVMVVLSCSRFKRSDYLVPAYPGAALFLGAMVDRLWRTARQRLASNRSSSLALSRVASPWGIGLLALLSTAGWLVRLEHSLPAEEPYRDYRAFAAIVRRHAPPPTPVTFFRAEAHALTFRVGRPVVSLVQWPELHARLLQPGVHHVILPPDSAAVARAMLPGVEVEEVADNRTLAGGSHERPLVLLRARPADRATHAVAASPATDRRPTLECGPAGPSGR